MTKVAHHWLEKWRVNREKKIYECFISSATHTDYKLYPFIFVDEGRNSLQNDNLTNAYMSETGRDYTQLMKHGKK